MAAEKEVFAPCSRHNNGRSVGNGWTSPPNGAAWGFDYLSCTATARSNMYDNAPNETRYIYTDFDSANQRLNGTQLGPLPRQKQEILMNAPSSFTRLPTTKTCRWGTPVSREDGYEGLWLFASIPQGLKARWSEPEGGAKRDEQIIVGAVVEVHRVAAFQP